MGCKSLSGDTVSNPLDPMTEHSKKAPVSNGLPGTGAFHPGVSAQLREYYQSVQEEGIPERFLQLLERLDAGLDRDRHLLVAHQNIVEARGAEATEHREGEVKLLQVLPDGAVALNSSL